MTEKYMSHEVSNSSSVHTGSQLEPRENVGHPTDRIIDQPRPSWRRLAAYAGILALILLTGWAIYSAQASVLRVDRSKVTIATARFADFSDDIPLQGKAVPKDLFLLDAASGGRVSNIFVRAGDIVVAGQPLLEFSNTALQLQVVQQESQINQALTQLQANESSLEQERVSNERALAGLEYEIISTRRQLRRVEVLYANGFVSVSQRDALSDKLNDLVRQRGLQSNGNATQSALRMRQLPLIRAQQVQLKQNLEIVRSKLDELVVRAPVAGKISDFNLNPGENRNSGDRLATIVPDTGVKVSADVDEFYLDRVRTGQTARVNIDREVYLLKVERVYPEVKNGTFKIDLQFIGKIPRTLLPGQAILGRLTLGANTRAMILPAGGWLQQGGQVAFVLDSAGTAARRQPLRIGRRSVDQVEILGGISAGQKVIVSEYSSWQKYEEVKLE
jgi:HlyD family secretion protein